MAVNHQNLSTNLQRILRQYHEDITEDAHLAAKTTAEGAIDKIKASAEFGGQGLYLRSLKLRQEQGRRVYNFKYIIYAAAPHYRLTHLLENGHRIVSKNGVEHGRSRDFPHWIYGHRFVQDKFPEILRDLIERR